MVADYIFHFLKKKNKSIVLISVTNDIDWTLSHGKNMKFFSNLSLGSHSRCAVYCAVKGTAVGI